LAFPVSEFTANYGGQLGEPRSIQVADGGTGSRWNCDWFL